MNESRNIHILFYKGNSVISKIIKKISKSETYSHCAIMIDELHLIESTWNKPNIISHFSYKKGEYDVYRLKEEITGEQHKEIMHFLKERINVRYDWRYIITRAGNMLFGTKIHNSLNHYTCDELLYDAFESQGIQLIDIDKEGISPEAISKSTLLKKL